MGMVTWTTAARYGPRSFAQALLSDDRSRPRRSPSG